jgi:FK506-binding nuclear protein
MAAIDPSAKPLEKDEPKRATLKLLRRPIDPDEFMNDDYEDSDQESGEESDDEEDGDKESKKTSKAKKQADAAIKKALKVAEANAMEVDPKNGSNEDEDEDSDGDDDEFEIEEFVICTLDAEKVSPGLCDGKARPLIALALPTNPRHRP